ncbi:colanic acid biosynthesis protein WcaH [Serratia fonticola]|jgi:colanic acid biosynthesis protein WcaH|uniref:Colanic acid biosynthesis protein WcaH n=1 Tax=Serratia fonticola TaxID=47917 RepID=A0A542BMP6_SERFO|nr:GDP-mannose mannosyl hydrolase [Serratia fonticola]TQI79815.1 colanic acid biosynthesis protein WcaH [Serratia fonticola]TQI98160.1 colanic acid biosynthesis protein WcaH [Serratia fonticola]TVZ67688.1 colanic acid biosynthesis protein WcaH [Serratia fonticola]
MFLSHACFKNVVKSTPLVSIDLIVENEIGHILLGRRTNRPARGYWFVPGGRVQKNETLDTAFQRLTQDEIGCKVSRDCTDFLGVYEHFYNENFSDEDFSTHYVVLGYHIKVVTGELSLPLEQHDSYLWININDLLSHKEVHDNTKAYFFNEKPRVTL